MSGVELKTIADYQLAIKQLDRNNPADKKKIEEYCLRIGELMQSQTVKSGTIEIKSAMGANFSVDPSIAQQPEIERMGKFRDEAYIKEKFGDEEMTDAKFEEIKNEYEAAKKELEELQKQNKKIKYSKYDDKEQFGTDKQQKFAEVEAAQARFEKARVAYDRAKILHDVNDGDMNNGIKKAAKRNVDNYTNVLNTQRVFLSKAEEEAAIVKDPSLDGKTKVLKDKDINTIMAIGQYAQYKIQQAEATGDPAEIDAAKAKYGLYTEMFNKDENGNIDFSADAINVRNAQNALVDESGFDQRFNLDEIETMSRMYGVSKGDIKSTVKKFGFGTESGHGQRWLAAGAAAGAALAGNAINALLGNTHSHKFAEATSTAQGETVQGEVNWIASNGETFYHYYEAQGGAAAASVVAEACAKLPLAGQLLGPALAGVTAFFLAKPQTEDAFGGANVEAVLKDINLVEGKDNKAIVLAIQEMEITGVESTDKAIKAAVLKAALGENTKKANTEELLAAFDQLEQAKEVIKQIEVPEKKDEEPVKEDPVKEDPIKEDPVKEDPVKEDPVKEDPVGENVDYDIMKDPDVEVRTELPRLKLREGTWYTSHAYIDADGKELTPAERKEVKRLLEQDANRIALVDTNGDGKADFKDRKVSLPTELTLPSGKKVKMADDAYERIMKLPAQESKKPPVNPIYGLHVAKIAGKWHVVDPKNNNKIIGGPYDTEAQAKVAEAKLEADANKPKQTE